MHKLDFDPELPSLSLVFDLEQVVQLFEERWPDRAATDGHAPTIRLCQLHDTKYEPRTRCVTAYSLMISYEARALEQTIGVVEMSSAGRSHRLFVDDPELPGLWSAINVCVMRRRFAAMLQDPSVEVRRITPLRYKPGLRCVLRYDVHASGGDLILFGKLLVDGSDHLTHTLQGLHTLSKSISTMPYIPAPLAYWSDLHMVIQPAVSTGVDLGLCAFDVAVDSSVREQWLRAAGAHLAALHAFVTLDAPRRGLTDELSELHGYCAAISQAMPRFALSFIQALDAVSVGAVTRAAATPVASHGTCRTDQFLVTTGRMAMIDLDSFCWAEPARDVANFLAYLTWKAIRLPQHAGWIDRARHAFLDGYLSMYPAVDMDSLTLYQAISMLRIIGRRFRSLSVGEWPQVPQLLDAAHASLATIGLRPPASLSMNIPSTW